MSPTEDAVKKFKCFSEKRLGSFVQVSQRLDHKRSNYLQLRIRKICYLLLSCKKEFPWLLF